MPTITKPNLYFDVVTYTGTGATQTISGLNFQPDFVWIKSRSAATDNKLTDAVRGATKGLISNSTGAETTDSTGVTAFTSSGFTLGSSSVYNNSGATYVAWCWKANGSGSSNTSGSITSTVSASTTSGFSVVNALMNTGTNQSVGHGLGVKPAMVLLKNRDLSDNWFVWHQSLASQTDSFLQLNTTAAVNAIPNLWGSGMTSTVIGLRPSSYVNASQNVIMYAFAEIAGYSKFGSYTGNGSADGPFCFTGMRPAYILVKCSSTTGPWDIFDDTRSPTNVASRVLYANTSDAEGGIEIDILSNGFKIRDTSGNVNTNGATYIFMALAENPFKYSLAR
jgi:hypothetical protein